MHSMSTRHYLMATAQRCLVWLGRRTSCTSCTQLINLCSHIIYGSGALHKETMGREGAGGAREGGRETYRLYFSSKNVSINEFYFIAPHSRNDMRPIKVSACALQSATICLWCFGAAFRLMCLQNLHLVWPVPPRLQTIKSFLPISNLLLLLLLLWFSFVLSNEFNLNSYSKYTLLWCDTSLRLSAVVEWNYKCHWQWNLKQVINKVFYTIL